jgi:hypothetical protein
MRVTAGRTVLLTYEGSVWPAVVTSVHGDGTTVNLTAFTEHELIIGGLMLLKHVRAGGGDGSKPGERCWHWPPEARKPKGRAKRDHTDAAIE